MNSKVGRAMVIIGCLERGPGRPQTPILNRLTPILSSRRLDLGSVETWCGWEAAKHSFSRLRQYHCGVVHYSNQGDSEGGDK